jgi:hypothetical protein
MRLATALLVLTVSANSWAGAALDDDKKPAPAQPNAQPAGGAAPASASGTDPATATNPEDLVQYGIDVRLREVYVPKGLLELFVDKAADGASNTGLGVDLVRKRGNLELQLGFEYEHINVGEGVWINKGDDVANGDEADYVLSPDHSGNNLGWFTIEFTFINHVPINKYVSFRYGGGAGLGIINGELDHYNVICNGATNATPEPGCVPNTLPNGRGTDSDGHNFSQPVKYDLPPVFPVINGIIGFQFHPMDKMVINLEGGIRTLPFIGLSVGYFIN